MHLRWLHKSGNTRSRRRSFLYSQFLIFLCFSAFYHFRWKKALRRKGKAPCAAGKQRRKWSETLHVVGFVFNFILIGSTVNSKFVRIESSRMTLRPRLTFYIFWLLHRSSKYENSNWIRSKTTDTIEALMANAEKSFFVHFRVSLRLSAANWISTNFLLHNFSSSRLVVECFSGE